MAREKKIKCVYFYQPLFKRRRASLIWSWRIWTQSRGPGSFSILLAVQYFSVNATLRQKQWYETIKPNKAILFKVLIICLFTCKPILIGIILNTDNTTDSSMHAQCIISATGQQWKNIPIATFYFFY